MENKRNLISKLQIGESKQGVSGAFIEFYQIQRCIIPHTLGLPSIIALCLPSDLGSSCLFRQSSSQSTFRLITGILGPRTLFSSSTAASDDYHCKCTAVFASLTVLLQFDSRRKHHSSSQFFTDLLSQALTQYLRFCQNRALY